MHCITGLRTARLIHLSRRSILTGLGIGTVALLAATTPASWAASGVTAGLTPDPETIDVATTDGTTVAVPVLLGGILTVSGGGLPAGTRIAVTWASALYAAEAAKLGLPVPQFAEGGGRGRMVQTRYGDFSAILQLADTAG